MLYVSTDLRREGRVDCPDRSELSTASAQTISSAVPSSSFVPGLAYRPSFTLSDGCTARFAGCILFQGCRGGAGLAHPSRPVLPSPDLLTNVSVMAQDPLSSSSWSVLVSEPANAAEPVSTRVLEARRLGRRGPATGARELDDEEDFGLAMDDSSGPVLRRAADLMFGGNNDEDDAAAPPAPTRRRLLKGSYSRTRFFRENYYLCARRTADPTLA